jgi:hypothetical protein
MGNGSDGSHGAGGRRFRANPQTGGGRPPWAPCKRKERTPCC